jgi:hypothetical protein
MGMMYFWLIPAVILLLVVVWLVYGAATKRKNAGVKTEGEVLVHKPPPENRSDSP